MHRELRSRILFVSDSEKRGMVMDNVIDFFALRPVFTHYGLRVIWIIFLLNAVIQLYIAFNTIFRVLAQRGISLEAWSPNFIPLVLNVVVQVALVRLFLELAGYILSNARRV
jgi:hypothetical protein